MQDISQQEWEYRELFEGHRLGRYQVCRELGRGFSSVVYEAFDTQRGRLVALKVLTFLQNLSADRRADLSERFAREARAISALAHPGIVAIYEVGQAGDGRKFIAMERLEGETLRARLLRDKALPTEEAVPIALQIADALQYAHERGVIHRDVKPDNVFLQSDGQVKLMDFGVAHVLSDESLTQAGTVVGSPAYMSPEQIGGETLDGRSDVFSLGVTLAEMLMGRKPFAETSIPAVMHSILNRSPQLDDLLPRALRKIVEKALAKNRLQRFSSAAAFAQALRTQVVPDLPAWEPASTLVVTRSALPPAYRSLQITTISGWAIAARHAVPHSSRRALGALTALLSAAACLWLTGTYRARTQADMGRAVPVVGGEVRQLPILWRKSTRKSPRPTAQMARKQPPSVTHPIPRQAERFWIVERVPASVRPAPPAAPAAPAPPAVPKAPLQPNLIIHATPVVRVAASHQERIVTPNAVQNLPSDPDGEQTDADDTDSGIPDGGPRLLRRAALLYPDWVPASSLRGTVILQVSVNADGNVTGATVARSSGSDTLDQAAIETVQDYEYVPAFQGGQPQPGIITQRITYP